MTDKDEIDRLLKEVGIDEGRRPNYKAILLTKEVTRREHLLILTEERLAKWNINQGTDAEKIAETAKAMLGWRRDLTQEGIEPNPGPSWNEILATLKQKILDDDDWNAIQKPLTEFKNEAKKLELLVTDIAVKKLIQNINEDTRLANDLSARGVTKALVNLLDEIVNPVSTGHPDNNNTTTDLQSKRKRGGDEDIQDQSMAQFWQSLNSATEANGVLSLPTGSFWCGKETLGHNLVIRQCYNDLWNMIQDMRANQGVRRVAVMGNPGIGKSWFLFYLLYQLKKLGATVMYERINQPYAYLLSSSGVMKAKDTRDFPELMLADMWYIVDGKPALEVEAFSILATSPRRGNWTDFMKMKDARRRWMPVWTLSEIELCRSACYPTLSQNTVQQLFDNWGGIPRYVLEKANDPEEQRSLERAIGKADLKTLTHTIGETDGPDDVSHKLVHIVVHSDGRYDDFHMNWASTYVARRCAEKFERECKEELRQFLARSEGEGTLGALRGYLFEGYSHNLVQRGGTFDI
jgi:hypothetical protein